MNSKRYGLLDVGLTGLAFQAGSSRLVAYVPQWVSANMVTTVGLVISLLIPFMMSISLSSVGGLILIALFLDFLDGQIARQRGTVSDFGRVLDATADLALWMGILVGLFVGTGNLFSLAILIAYTIDVFWRIQLGHSASLLTPASDTYDAANRSDGFLNRMKIYYYPFVNYYDLICVLALILIFAPQWVPIWLAYEFIRRIILLLRKAREIHYIYKDSNDEK